MNSNTGKLAAGAVASVLAVAAAIIKPWEGKRNEPYEDAVGVLTVCFGHTGTEIEPRKYSDEECNELLKGDMAAANGAVRACIRSPMNINQEAALTSAVFNLGNGVVCGSTLARYANAGNWAAACRELTDAKNAEGEKLGWSYADGQFLPGLRRRRFAERAVCEREPPK
ncbi:lysozyme [Dyella sp. 2RAB6]|uniref:lysozyme n=1 Tax=Dyella sp. 2RAB6 TaxID=3232992 RepID=UPI003F8FDA42